MKTEVTFRHMETSQPIKKYIMSKLERISKHFDKSMNAQVILSMEKFYQVADVTITMKKHTVKANERSEDMYASIDKVIDKIGRLLTKHKEKVKDHRNTSLKRSEVTFTRRKEREVE